jgi:hypothetical protein
MIGTAVAVLLGAAVAYAAGSFNTYTASESFSPSAAGSAKKPSALSIHETWVAKGTNGHPTAPLTKIVAKIYGMKTDGKDFKVCTAKTINNAGAKNGTWNKACPGGETGPALIGQGPVNAEFVSPNPPYTVAGQCNPYLYIYNGGGNTQVFFFTETPFAPSPKYTCLGGAVHTGAATAYNGTATQPTKGNGETWTLTIPLPPSVSTNAGGTHLYASLVKLNVTYAKKTEKKHGKTIAYGASFACKGGKRPYSFQFTAQNYNGLSPKTGTVTVSHTDSCG